MKFLRQSTAVTVAAGPFLALDGFTPKTALTSQSGRAIKAGAGGAFAPASWSHDGGGHYLVGLGTGDTDTLGRLRLDWSDPATFLPVWEDFTVLAPAVYDWLFGTAAPNTTTPDNAGIAAARTRVELALPAVAASQPNGLLTYGNAGGQINPNSGMVPIDQFATIQGAGQGNSPGTVGWALLLANSYLDASIASRSTLDAAGVRTAIGMTSANLDTQLAAIGSGLDKYAAARIYGAIAPLDSQGRQVFYGVPGSADEGVPLVRLGPTNPRGGRTVELDPAP